MALFPWPALWVHGSGRKLYKPQGLQVIGKWTILGHCCFGFQKQRTNGAWQPSPVHWLCSGAGKAKAVMGCLDFFKKPRIWDLERGSLPQEDSEGALPLRKSLLEISAKERTGEHLGDALSSCRFCTWKKAQGERGKGMDTVVQIRNTTRWILVFSWPHIYLNPGSAYRSSGYHAEGLVLSG